MDISARIISCMGQVRRREARRTAIFAVLAATAYTFAQAQPVWAAEPSDAIKHMPQLNHISTFMTTEHTNPQSQEYKDHYTGEWELTWEPPAIRLAPSTTAEVWLQYQIEETDFLNRISQSSKDGRQAVYNFRANLNCNNALTGSYQLVQTDTFSSSSPRWISKQEKIAELKWEIQGYPAVRIRDYNNTNVSQYDTTQQIPVQSSISQSTSVRSSFEQKQGPFGQRYELALLNEHTRNYLNDASTSTTKSTWYATRQFPLQNLGKLTLGCHHYEENKESTAFSPTRNSTTKYSLDLSGNVLSWPLAYSITYVKQNKVPAEEIVDRKLTLTYRPPTPSNKSLVFKYFTEFNETQGPSLASSETIQQLRCTFQPNPLTTGVVFYKTTVNTDLQQKLRTKETELINGELTYTVPGKRGQFHGTYQELTTRDPINLKTTYSYGISLKQKVLIGPRAHLTFLHNQVYAGNSDPFKPNSNDMHLSGITYHINSGKLGGGHRLSLDAAWKQRLQVWSTERKTATQLYDLKFTWYTPVGWTYSLQLRNTKDESNWNLPEISYGSRNEIIATVVYKF